MRSRTVSSDDLMLLPRPDTAPENASDLPLGAQSKPVCGSYRHALPFGTCLIRPRPVKRSLGRPPRAGTAKMAVHSPRLLK